MLHATSASVTTGVVSRTSLLAILASLAHLACSSSNEEPSTTPPPATTPAPTESPCADGFALDADGACLPAAAPASCPGGSRPRVGSTTCEAVGWTATCPPGTTRDASGFGCATPAPESTCSGATREAYGQATCAPVGDCGGTFPPAGAIVVDGALLDAQLDATHFRTLEAAVAAAPDGATVAVAPGVYEEAVTVTRPLTLIGRCAASVELRSPPTGTASAKPGIDVKAKGVTVRGLTLTGHVDGIAVGTGGDATITEVVVRDARYAGILVERGRARITGTKVENTRPQADRRGGFDLAGGNGAEITIDDSTLTGGVQGVLAGASTLALTRVVITKQAPDAGSSVRPAGIAAVAGSKVSLTRSVIHDLVADGAASAEDDATVELDETIVSGLHIDGSAARGYGLLATYGGHVVARSVLLSAVESLAVLARDEGSTLELTDTTVLGPQVTTTPSGPLVNDGRGAGISVKSKAAAVLDGVAVIGTWGYGVASEVNGTLSMKHSFVDAPRGALGTDPAKASAYGLGVTTAKATLSDVTFTRCAAAGINVGKGGSLSGDHVLVRDVIEGEIPSSGAGLAVGEAGRVDLDASAIEAATATGVLITRGGQSFVRLVRSSVRGTRKARDGFGHGVTVRLDARVVLTGTSIVDHPGIGIAADGGRALLDGATVARNAVGIHAQSGSFLVETDDADAESLTDGEVRVATTTRFASNATRIGSGVVALPAPVLP